MVAPRGKHQQRLGQRVHRRRAAAARAAVPPAACRRARACSTTSCPRARSQAGQRRSMCVDLAGAVDAFEGDEAARSSTAACRWYWFTARLWSASVSLNSLLPSPRATKYSASVGSGPDRRAQCAARPGIAIGVGGRPARSVGVVRRVGQQVALAQIAVEALAQAVDDRRVGLQRHADAQPVDEHAGNQAALAPAARFPSRRSRPGSAPRRATSAAGRAALGPGRV